MFLDLVPEEFVERRTRLGIARGDPDDAASRGLLERVRNLGLQSLHGHNSGRDFTVGHKRLLEIALTK